MYDFEELQPANDALWSALAARLWARGIDAPAALTRMATPDALWTDPGLLLGQTCGYPLVTSLRGRVRLVATPRYHAPGCQGSLYRSAVVVRVADPARGLADLQGRRCAVNGACSNSGMNVLRAAIAPIAGGAARFFGSVVTTGAHACSVAAVADDHADVAAIDCVTWAHLQRLRPELTDALRVLTWTVATPGLPLISAATMDAVTMQALEGALADVDRDTRLDGVRRTLFLDACAGHALGGYDVLLHLERQACSAGYPQLR